MSDKKLTMDELTKKLAELRKLSTEQRKSNVSGTATNYRAATQTRREIARTLTAINSQSNEGEKE